MRIDEQSKLDEGKALEYSSVQKAIVILLSFIPNNKALGNSELSESLGLNKSTVCRLTQVLAHYGLIQQDEKTQKYELGRTSALLGMAVEVSRNEQLAALARPYVDFLRDAVGESVCLEVLIPSGYVKVVCGAVGPPPLSVTFPDSIPTNIAAGAKVILAYSADQSTDDDSQEYKDRLETVRLHGLAYDHGEANAEVHTVSVAVFNHARDPIAALSICVPANRVQKILDSKNVELLKKTATMISGRCPRAIV